MSEILKEGIKASFEKAKKTLMEKDMSELDDGEVLALMTLETMLSDDKKYTDVLRRMYKKDKDVALLFHHLIFDLIPYSKSNGEQNERSIN